MLHELMHPVSKPGIILSFSASVSCPVLLPFVQFGSASAVLCS